MPIAPENRELSKVLTKHLVGHSGRKTHFLFWNMIHRKNRVLCFTNQQKKDLNVINDPNTIARFTKVKDIVEWNMICDVLDRIVQQNTTHVVRVDYLMTYLKKQDFEIDKLELELSSENSICYSVMKPAPTDEDPNATKASYIHIAYPCPDLHNEYFMKKWKDLYTPVLLKPKEELCPFVDVTENWMNVSKEMLYEVEDNDHVVNVPIIEGADFPPPKFITTENKNAKNPPTVQIHTLPGKISRLLYVYRSDKLDVITIRVYLNIFIAEKKKKK